MKLKINILLFIFVVLFTGCNNKDDNSKDTKDTKQKIENNFLLKTVNKKIINIKKDGEKWYINGGNKKIILLDFFATWCPPCKAEIPHLNNLQVKYKDNFEVIGILLEEGKSNSEIQQFIKEYKIKYTITNDENNQKLASIIGNVKTIPTMFLINTNGKIIQKYVGIVPEEMLASDIKRALEKQVKEK
jgi:thiol-disulfide isomerase/thioredoxin